MNSVYETLKKDSLYENWELPMTGICQVVATTGMIRIVVTSKLRVFERDFYIGQDGDDNWIMYDIPGDDEICSIQYNVSKLDRDDEYRETTRRSRACAWFIDKNVIYDERVTKDYVSWGLFQYLSKEELDEFDKLGLSEKIERDRIIVEKAQALANARAQGLGIKVRSDYYQRFVHNPF